MLNQFVKDYFSFTKKEKIAVAVLIFFILSFYLLPFFIMPAKPLATSVELEQFRKLEAQFVNENRKHNTYYNNDKKFDEDDGSLLSYADPPLNERSPDLHKRSGFNRQDDLTQISSGKEDATTRLFYFDPNTVSEKGWRQLGLRDRTIGTILKYLSKGGHFYSPQDLKKIYGLRPDEYERIASFIRINHVNKKSAEQWYRRGYGLNRVVDNSGLSDNKLQKNSSYPASIGNSGDVENSSGNMSRAFTGSDFRGDHYSSPPKPVDINKADTSDWIDLPGIGSKLANRIVQFREKLGGFYDIMQISETWGLPDSTFQKIKPLLKKGEWEMRKLNINTASRDDLKAHPYIRWELAKAIVGYRDQHGPFKTLEELQQIGAIGIESYNKMLPYLIIE